MFIDNPVRVALVFENFCFKVCVVVEFDDGLCFIDTLRLWLGERVPQLVGLQCWDTLDVNFFIAIGVCAPITNTNRDVADCVFYAVSHTRGDPIKHTVSCPDCDVWELYRADRLPVSVELSMSLVDSVVISQPESFGLAVIYCEFVE